MKYKCKKYSHPIIVCMKITMMHLQNVWGNSISSVADTNTTTGWTFWSTMWSTFSAGGDEKKFDSKLKRNFLIEETKYVSTGLVESYRMTSLFFLQYHSRKKWRFHNTGIKTWSRKLAHGSVNMSAKVLVMFLKFFPCNTCTKLMHSMHTKLQWWLQTIAQISCSCYVAVRVLCGAD